MIWKVKLTLKKPPALHAMSSGVPIVILRRFDSRGLSKYLTSIPASRNFWNNSRAGAVLCSGNTKFMPGSLVRQAPNARPKISRVPMIALRVNSKYPSSSIAARCPPVPACPPVQVKLFFIQLSPSTGQPAARPTHTHAYPPAKYALLNDAKPIDVTRHLFLTSTRRQSRNTPRPQ